MKLSKLAIVFAAGALVLTGCSNAETKSPTAQTPSDDPVAQSAKTAVEPFLTAPTDIGISEPLVGPIATDKEVYWLQCGSPSCVQLGEYLQEATDAVGWDLRIIDAGLTAESIKSAWAQAVDNDPDAVITSGFSRAFYEEELKQLSDRGVPVLNMTTADPPKDGFAATQNYGPDFLSGGERLGNFVLSESGSDVNAVSMTVSAFENLSFVADGFESTIKDACAECNVDSLDIPVTSMGGDLPTRVTTYLQSHPDTNWVYMGYADMMVGVPAALEAAGIPDTVRFVTIDTLPTTSLYLEEGKYLAAVDGSPKPEMMWRHIDFLLRHFNDESTEPATAHTLPAWLITQGNVPTTTEDFPLVADYQDQYKTLWGLN